jgi:hypothetical protein
MATITIKIESEQLAREVLTQLGYLPDDIPDLISVESEEPEEPEAVPESVPVKPALKTPMELLRERMICANDLLPKGTRKMPDAQKQCEFCTTEDPKEDGVEPEAKEIGASLAVVYSPDTEKESDALYQQCMEVRKSIPPAAERLKAQADQLLGDELLGYLDAMCEHEDKDMREAAIAMLRAEYAGQTIKMWPNIKKILDNQ